MPICEVLPPQRQRFLRLELHQRLGRAGGLNGIALAGSSGGSFPQAAKMGEEEEKLWKEAPFRG